MAKQWMFYLAGQNEGQASILQAWHSVKSPTQSRPPNWGAGLSHLLDLVWPPPPQDTVHSVQSSHSLKPPSTTIIKLSTKHVYDEIYIESEILLTITKIQALLGQGPLLQLSVSVWELSGQSNPPLEGGMQARVLVFVPSPPQATEHSDHSSQSAHS